MMQTQRARPKILIVGQTPPPFGPALRDQEPCLDCFAEADFVGQDDTLGERVASGEQRCIHLVRIQVDLCVEEGARHTLHGVTCPLQRQLVGKVGELVRAVVHASAVHVRCQPQTLVAKLPVPACARFGAAFCRP